MTEQATVSDLWAVDWRQGCGHARKRLRAFSLDNVTTLRRSDELITLASRSVPTSRFVVEHSV